MKMSRNLLTLHGFISSAETNSVLHSMRLED
nr:MAG TPA: sufurylase [Caudoviricetes sp.]